MTDDLHEWRSAAYRHARERDQAQAERDRYRAAWESARSRAGYYRDLNASACENWTSTLRRASQLAEAVEAGRPRHELMAIIHGEPSARLAVVPDAAEVPTARELGEALGHAMDAVKPGAEPVFCHHPDARRTVRETMQAGWGRCAVVRLECPTCQAWAEQLNDEPILTPTLLNTARCTDACAEQHTYRPGCQIAPDFSKPILRSKP